MTPLPCNLKTQEFIDLISNLSPKVDEIIETGCYNGLGSTLIFAKTGKPVISLECHHKNVLLARENLKDYKNANILYSMSLNYKDMVYHILNEDYSVPEGIRNDSVTPVQFYLDELTNFIDQGTTIPEDMLHTLVNNYKKQLIFLDSNGGTGMMELQAVPGIDIFDEDSKLDYKVVILDDIDHVKHYKSVEYMKKDERYKVNISSCGRFCWFWKKGNVLGL